MNADTSESSGEPVPSAFPPTMWTVVLEASQGDTEAAEKAMRKLCIIYQQPILIWLQRHGHDRDAAHDLAQGFLEYLLEKNRLLSFTKGSAKFRSFLLECLQRFIRGEWRKANAAKRGAGLDPAPLEEDRIGTEVNLERILDRSFALTVHQLTTSQMEERFNRSGKQERFHELQRFLLGDDPDVTYAQVAERLGMKPNAVKKAVFDLRDDYYQTFHQHVAQTTKGEAIEEEMRYLVTLLADAEQSFT